LASTSKGQIRFGTYHPPKLDRHGKVPNLILPPLLNLIISSFPFLVSPFPLFRRDQPAARTIRLERGFAVHAVVGIVVVGKRLEFRGSFCVLCVQRCKERE
jgi:hypothetical protein